MEFGTIRIVHDFTNLGVVLEAIIGKLLIASGSSPLELVPAHASPVEPAQDAAPSNAPPPELAPQRRRGRPRKDETAAAVEPGMFGHNRQASIAAPVPAAPVPPVIPTIARITPVVAAPAASAPDAAPAAKEGTYTEAQTVKFRDWVVGTFMTTPGCGDEAYTRIREEHGNISLHVAPISAVDAFMQALEAYHAAAVGGKKSPAGF